MNLNSVLLEFLISGFFAIACLRSRASDSSNVMRPRDLLRLTSRLDRLRRTRWQWFAMVLVIVCIRLQTGVPLIVELTAALQFVVFLALPARGQSKELTKAVVGRRGRKPPVRQIGKAGVS